MTFPKWLKEIDMQDDWRLIVAKSEQSVLFHQKKGSRDTVQWFKVECMFVLNNQSYRKINETTNERIEHSATEATLYWLHKIKMAAHLLQAFFKLYYKIIHSCQHIFSHGHAVYTIWFRWSHLRLLTNICDRSWKILKSLYWSLCWGEGIKLDQWWPIVTVHEGLRKVSITLLRDAWV